VQAAGGTALTERLAGEAGRPEQDDGRVTETAEQDPVDRAPASAEPLVDTGTVDQRFRRRTGTLIWVAAAVLGADVLTKVVVVATLSDRAPVKLAGGLVYLVLTRNSGAAFSLAQGATILFTLIAAVVIVVILRTASRLGSAPWAVCLGLVLGGAAGNLADRIFRAPGPLRGRVVDWVSLLDPAGQTWPVFNLADAAIVSGGVLAVLLAFAGFELTGGRTRRPPTTTPR
jgi:signal peptidase II